MKKKICMIVPSFSAKGGITSVVSGYKGSSLEEQFDIKYIETYCDGNIFKKFFIVIKAYFYFLYLLLFWHPNIVHVHSSFGGSFYRKMPFIILSNLFGKPIINHIHGADFDDFYLNAKEKKKRLIELVYNKCSNIIVLSKEWEQRLGLIVNEDKIVIIENYSILNLNAIEERKNKANTHNVLFLGFICERKGCYDIPRIVKLVKNAIPNVKFVLAGTGDIDKINSITDDDVVQNIIYPGWVRGTEKDKLLREADLFFLPSYNEGMPMSILDAMGYGLPIVSTDVGGISKIVHDKQNGFICRPGDIDNLSKSIIELLTNDLFLKKAGNESVRIVENNFSLKKHIKKLLILYGGFF